MICLSRIESIVQAFFKNMIAEFLPQYPTIQQSQLKTKL